MTQQIETTMPNTKRTLTAANDYRTFLRALKKGAWTIDQLTGEADQDEKLQALVELMGDKFETSLIKSFDKGDVDQMTGEVLWSEHKRKAAPKDSTPKLAGTGSSVLPTPPPAPVAKTPEQVQTAVDEAVEKSGANILNMADCNEILAQFGLKRGEVTERMVERADSRAQKKLRETLAKRNDQTSNRVKVVWEGDSELDPDHNPDHPIRGAAVVRREMEEREKAATRERLNGLRSKNSDNGDVESRIMTEGEDTFTFEEEGNMKLSEKAARTLLIAAGVEAKTWGHKKLAATLNDQEQLIEATEPEDEKQKERFNTILKAVADGKKITVTQAQAVGTNGTSSKKEGKKSDKPKKEKAEPGKGQDEFGSRLGTVRAIFNAALSKKPKTSAEIAEETKYPSSRIQAYLRDLSSRDPRVVLTDKGWMLKS